MRSILGSLALLVHFSAGAAPVDLAAHARAQVHASVDAVPSGLVLADEQVLPWAGGTAVRFHQELGGVPVEGSQVVVSLDRHGEVRRIEGELMDAPDVSPVPTLRERDAVQAADAVIAEVYGAGELWPSRAELRWWVDGARPRLVWAVDSSTAEPVGTYRSLVDAHSGEVVSSGPTLVHARAVVYPENPETSEIAEVELLGLPSDATTLDGEYGFVRSCTDLDGRECLDTTQLALADDAGDFFYDTDPTSLDDPFAEVQTYYHLDLISRYFDDVHGFEHRAPIEAIVNFSYKNAFYGDLDGDGIGEIGAGQSNLGDAAYDSDVVYHEFTHSVFVETVGLDPKPFGADSLGSHTAPRGINEGMADIFAMVLTGDPKHAEYGGTSFGVDGPVRDHERDRRCPDDLYGEGHGDSEIWSSMAWNMMEDARLGTEVVEQLFYGIMVSIPEAPTWQANSDALVTVAGDLRDASIIDDDAHDAILEHLAASGLPDCERIIALDDGRSVTMFAHLLVAGTLELGPVPMTAQLSLEAPEHATEVRLRIDEWRATQSGMAWTVYVRRGEPVRHDVRRVSYLQIPVPTDFDFSVDGTGTLPHVIIDERSDPPLEPGATYYFTIAARDAGGVSGYAQGEVTASGVVTSVEPEPIVEDEEGGGCGCHTTASAAPALLFLPLWALLARRRRR